MSKVAVTIFGVRGVAEYEFDKFVFLQKYFRPMELGLLFDGLNTLY